MAELTFPLSVVTLESRQRLPLEVVSNEANIELFGVGFPSSPQNKILEWSCSHEGLGAQPLLMAIGSAFRVEQLAEPKSLGTVTLTTADQYVVFLFFKD
jgi:hypothetical protein